jgi:hypothetical protein
LGFTENVAPTVMRSSSALGGIVANGRALSDVKRHQELTLRWHVISRNSAARAASTGVRGETPGYLHSRSADQSI